jgi:hypothetical protein
MNTLQRIEEGRIRLIKALDVLMDRTIPTNHTYTIDIKLKNVNQLQQETLLTVLNSLELNEVRVAKYKIEND